MFRNLFVILFVLLVASSCGKDDYVTPVPVPVSDAMLVDLGQVNVGVNFSMSKINDRILCTFNTKGIKKGDTISYVSVDEAKRKLIFNVNSSPYDFDCNSDSCFTAHQVSLYIDQVLNKGSYSVEVYVNNILSFDYTFNYLLSYE